jgi:hypothetical protein
VNLKDRSRIVAVLVLTTNLFLALHMFYLFDSSNSSLPSVLELPSSFKVRKTKYREAVKDSGTRHGVECL